MRSPAILLGLFLNSFLGSPVVLADAETLTIPQTLVKRCNDGKELSSCYELGELYQLSNVGKNIEIGNAYTLRGCELEMKRKCTLEEANRLRDIDRNARKKSQKELKEAMLKAEPTPKTKDETQCESGGAEACYQAATHFQFIAPKTDSKRAKALYERGCKLGHQQSCETLKLIRENKIKVFDVEM